MTTTNKVTLKKLENKTDYCSPISSNSYQLCTYLFLKIVLLNIYGIKIIVYGYKRYLFICKFAGNSNNPAVNDEK